MKSENEKLENDMNAVDEKYHQLNKIYQEVVAKNSELIDRWIIFTSKFQNYGGTYIGLIVYNRRIVELI